MSKSYLSGPCEGHLSSKPEMLSFGIKSENELNFSSSMAYPNADGLRDSKKVEDAFVYECIFKTYIAAKYKTDFQSIILSIIKDRLTTYSFYNNTNTKKFTIGVYQDKPTGHAFRYGFTKTEQGITANLLDSWARSDSIVKKDNQIIAELINISQSFIENEQAIQAYIKENTDRYLAAMIRKIEQNPKIFHKDHQFDSKDFLDCNPFQDLLDKKLIKTSNIDIKFEKIPCIKQRADHHTCAYISWINHYIYMNDIKLEKEFTIDDTHDLLIRSLAYNIDKENITEDQLLAVLRYHEKFAGLFKAESFPEKINNMDQEKINTAINFINQDINNNSQQVDNNNNISGQVSNQASSHANNPVKNLDSDKKIKVSDFYKRPSITALRWVATILVTASIGLVLGLTGAAVPFVILGCVLGFAATRFLGGIVSAKAVNKVTGKQFIKSAKDVVFMGHRPFIRRVKSKKQKTSSRTR